MSSNTLTLVEEFVRSSEPQLRKNALTALAVLESQESVKRIAEIGLRDPDSDVRKRAEAELVGLDPAAHAAAVSPLTQGLKQENKEIQQRAYAILGLLRSKGCHITNAEVPWRDRFRLVAGMNPHLYPVRNFRFRARGWKPGAYGILIGSIFLAWFMYVRIDNTRPFRLLQITLAIAGLSIVGIPLVALATQRATPINLQLNRLTAALVEVTTSGFLGLIGAMVWYFLLFILYRGRLFGGRSDLIPLAIPLIVLLIATVRAGTILSFGILTNQRLNRWLQVLGGVVFASLLMSLPVTLLGGHSYSAPNFLDGAWIVHLPLSFGAANAFAKVDGEAPPMTGSATRRSRLLFLIAAFLGALVIDFYLWRTIKF